MIEIPYGKDYLGSLVLITAGADDFKTTTTLADGDFKVSSGAQALTTLTAETAPFTSGSEEPRVGDPLTGAEDAQTCIYMGSRLSSGSWSGGDAAGEIFVRNVSGVFDTGGGGENLNNNRTGTSNVLTISADFTDIGVAEIATTGEIVYALTATETASDYLLLLAIDTATKEWKDTAERFKTFGHPLAADPRGVRWAGVLPQYAILDTTGVFTDTQTVVVGGKTYTSQTTLTDVNGNFHAGADAQEGIYNLCAAIMLAEYVTFTSGSVLPSIGDVISNNGQTATVVGVGQLTTGSWGGGNAEGVIFCTGVSGVFAAGAIANDTTSTADIATASGDFDGGPGAGYAASMTENSVVEALPGTQSGSAGTIDQLVVYTKAGQSGQINAVSETQTNASWMDADDAAITQMESLINTAGLWADLPTANNWDSPTNDDDANDYFFEAEDEDGIIVEGYIEDTDVDGGSSVNGVLLPFVRVTFQTNNKIRADLAGSWRIDYTIVPERQVPVRVLSKLSTVPLSTQEKTDAQTATAAALVADVQTFKKNTALNDFPFYMELTDGNPGTGLTVAVQLSKDAAAFASAAGPVAEIGSGWYQIDFTAADLNADLIGFKATATGAKQTNLTIRTES